MNSFEILSLQDCQGEPCRHCYLYRILPVLNTSTDVWKPERKKVKEKYKENIKTHFLIVRLSGSSGTNTYGHEINIIIEVILSRY